MASPAVPSASLLNKLKVAADAATAFNIACKTALGPLNTPNTTSGAIDNNNDMGPVNTVLMENVLQRWRENSERKLFVVCLHLQWIMREGHWLTLAPFFEMQLYVNILSLVQTILFRRMFLTSRPSLSRESIR